MPGTEHQMDKTKENLTKSDVIEERCADMCSLQVNQACACTFIGGNPLIHPNVETCVVGTECVTKSPEP